MLTIENLTEFGIDTKEGLARCMNNEAFYFKMLAMGLSNEYFDTLEKALSENKQEEAFEAAHALKGVVGNLAITPLYAPLSEITELLRAHKEAEYAKMYQPVKEMRDKLLAMC